MYIVRDNRIIEGSIKYPSNRGTSSWFKDNKTNKLYLVSNSKIYDSIDAVEHQIKVKQMQKAQTDKEVKKEMEKILADFNKIKR